MKEKTPIVNNDKEESLTKRNAQKQGGSIGIILRADAARAIGLEPRDLEPGDSLKFFASKSNEYGGRLILDRA